MYRIIYLNDQLVYEKFDSDNYNVIADYHMYLKKCSYKIICIVDYKIKVILNKCIDYQSHINNIDSYTF